jgi:hypothetical protein
MTTKALMIVAIILMALGLGAKFAAIQIEKAVYPSKGGLAKVLQWLELLGGATWLLAATTWTVLL